MSAATSNPIPIYRASTTAPVNIAVVKYWGKRNAALNLPTNSSLSVTLSQSDLRTLTTAACSSSFSHSASPSVGGDQLVLNGEASDVSGARIQACFGELRKLRAAIEASDPSLPKLSAMPLRIVSENNFPTAAGLASSAAGFAALVRAVADLYQLPQSAEELSVIARQGSGSACRSLFGGYVAWEMGRRDDDGLDSRAELVAESSHWPEMRALILVVSAAKKDVSSTAGMQRTVATSALFAERVRSVVPASMKAMREAIAQRDFAQFARVAMMESNSFHSTCADSYPPIFYMNDVSRAAIRAVEVLNHVAGRVVAAYTFDAGPNAVIFHLDSDRDLVVGAFASILQGVAGFATHGDADNKSDHNARASCVEALRDAGLADLLRNGVTRVILTGVGQGPMKTSQHLVSESGEIVSSNNPTHEG